MSMGKFYAERRRIIVIASMVIAFFCHVSSVFVDVLREEQDIFTNPVSSVDTNCWNNVRRKACEQRDARSHLLNGLCVCKCTYKYSTFLESSKRCANNRKMRNKTGISDGWTYLLISEGDSPGSTVGVISLTSNKNLIKFKIRGVVGNVNKCIPYEAEIADLNGKWTQITNHLSNMSVDIVDISNGNYLAHLNLTWNDNVLSSHPFGGKIMRIHIQCIRPQRIIDDYLIFKVNGTFPVEFFEGSSVLTTISSVLPSSFPRSLSSVHISRNQMTSTLYSTPMGIASTVSNTAPLHLTVTTAASSYQHDSLIKTGSPASSERTNFLVTAEITLYSTPMVIASAISSANPVYSTVKTAATSYQYPSVKTGSSVVYEETSFLVTSSVASNMLVKRSISPSITYTPSVISSGPDKQSNGSSATEVVTGTVIGVMFTLIIAVIIFYVLRKRKLKQSRQHDPGKEGFGDIGKDLGNFPLPALSNPVFQEGTYENPEDIHKDKKNSSGIKSIDSALYDQCLIVENPSARNGVVSVYDNVCEKKIEEELAYKSLDQAKREPPSEYQSLIKPTNEYFAASESLDSSLSPEPVYSVVDDESHNDVTTTSSELPKEHGVPEPVYNIADSKSDPDYHILGESSDSEGKREQVYSVLESE